MQISGCFLQLTDFLWDEKIVIGEELRSAVPILILQAQTIS